MLDECLLLMLTESVIAMWHNGLVITPFTTDIKHRMCRYSNSMAQNLYSLDNIFDPKDSKDIITNVIKIHDRITQCKRINERVKRHEHDLKTIDTSQTNPLESLLMKSIDFSVTNKQDIFSPVSDIINTTKIKPITRIDRPRLLHRIISNSVQPYKFQIWRHIISRNDCNWRWHHYIHNTECTRCNQTTDQTLTHELLTCDKTSSIRDTILESVQIRILPARRPARWSAIVYLLKCSIKTNKTCHTVLSCYAGFIDKICSLIAAG